MSRPPSCRARRRAGPQRWPSSAAGSHRGLVRRDVEDALAAEISRVDLLVHEVDRDPGLLLAVSQHPEAGHDASVMRKDRAVNVQESLPRQIDQRRLEDLRQLTETMTSGIRLRSSSRRLGAFTSVGSASGDSAASEPEADCPATSPEPRADEPDEGAETEGAKIAPHGWRVVCSSVGRGHHIDPLRFSREGSRTASKKSGR